MVCLARRLPVEDDLVFVAYARLDQPCASEPGAVLGALTHWGFFESDGSDRDLPVGFAARFVKRHW
jgi:hypothetical protein